MKSFDVENWRTQLRKGILELCILNLLAQGELYAYDIVKQLTKVPGLVVTEGTIYPLLSRLRKTGLLETRLQESASGPARKYYRLTAQGQLLCDQMNFAWDELNMGVLTLRLGRLEAMENG